MPAKIGFDNERYLEQQSAAILERVKGFNSKLYLEFGGKLLFDYHASRVLPGFNLALGYTLLYLSLIVLIPLSAAFIKTTELSLHEFWAVVSAPRVVASYKLTFGASLIGALINAVFGVIVAWVLVRYKFPGRRLVDALVDLPFALPTAVRTPDATYTLFIAFTSRI